MTKAPVVSRVFAEFARQQLAQFASGTAGVGAAVLLTGDGHAVATHQVDRNLSAKVAAMGSSLLALGEAFTREVGAPGMKNVMIEADGGTVIVMAVPGAKPRLVLAVVATATATLGQVLWSTRQCSEALAKTFKEH